MNYAKLSEAAIVGGAGCVKGIQCWSSAAPLSPLPVAESCLIRALANGQWDEAKRVLGGGGVDQATWWQVDCLGGTHQERQVRCLLWLFTEVTDRQIWADLYSSPSGNIITKQRPSEELPFQHSALWRLPWLCKMLRVLKSGLCMLVHFQATVFVLY